MEHYKTSGVCARAIDFEIENGKIKSVFFDGGCRGNTTGVSVLSRGRTIDEVINLLEGIPCRGATSCPDQFAKALKAYKATHNL